MNSLVGTLAHLRADDFVDSAVYPALTFEGLTQARVTVKGSGAAVELRIGGQDPKTKRYPVSVGKDTGVVWIFEPTVKALLQNPLSSKK